MNIGIIGGGATGLLISYYLSKLHDVTLYVRRNEQKLLIKKYGIYKENDKYTSFINVKQITELEDEQLLILCVKSVHLKAVIETIKKKKIRTPLLFLQNGMGHVNYFQLLNNDIYVGVIEHGVVRKNDYTFCHLGYGKIKLSSISNRTDAIDLAKRLSSDDFPFERVDNWQLLLKEKLIINAVINPLTALFDVKNRCIVDNSYIRKLAFQLCKEASSVLKLDLDVSWERVKTIAQNTGENTSSMRSDILNKRQTEIESILGYILFEATEDIPLVKIMSESIHALEERNNR